MNDKLGKKPVTPDRELLELLEEWVAPDVTESQRSRYTGKTNFMGIPLDELYSKVIAKEEIEEEEIPPLTAEEIQQIRQDAYDEGFESGKSEGYQAGEAQGREEGHEIGIKSGHEEGYLAGLEQGQAEIDIKVARLTDLTHQLYHPIEKVDAAAEQQLLNLVVMLAESVIRHETKSNKDALLSVIHEATASLPFNTKLSEIHIHPDDLELLSEIYTAEAMIEQKWIIKEEPSYQPGDIIVMTPDSLIDRSVKQRIKQTIEPFIEKALLDKEQNDHVPQTTRHIPQDDLDKASPVAKTAKDNSNISAEQATDSDNTANTIPEDNAVNTPVTKQRSQDSES
ncbi:hypothetical protein GCM10008107_09350 [Psychrosphaera saromensis]|uniref:Flagellar assembly protein FliH n=1 Tax=Psychrosphaera saromensis TaxID=716813 RepID=A0A2S7UV09_9GAMM|nr:flagellar assembly protein FliH [Psychrosphaera saromensis]PQJ53773.1 hypothetical protein BTO11_08935 [Psychrosphaera saromensis]GHB62402.1 hypothetical protein GCM10008107_09350 [Psychrosphaera saromensis]GLQ15438.1 hypothetical protein GCM10007917_28930 [Psychrosphaera saromensis]